MSPLAVSFQCGGAATILRVLLGEIYFGQLREATHIRYPTIAPITI